MTTFLQRDDFAVTARVLGALFYYSPESHETAPLVQALLNDDWQAQWPLDAEALAPVAAMFVPSGWIVRAYYLAILHWRYVSGCAKTEFSLTWPGICFRGRPAFWTYLSIMPGIRFIRRWGNWRV